MCRTARRLLVVLATALAGLAVLPTAAGALDMAPPTTEDKPPLWATLEPECIGAKGDTPAMRWRAGNATNGPHVLSFYENGHLVYDTVVQPGQIKTAVLSSHLWEDSYRHFQIRWKSQDQLLAAAKPWFDCTQPVLTFSFGAVDGEGRPCDGTVVVTVANSGNQNGAIRLYADGIQPVAHLVVPVGGSETVHVEADAGTWISASQLVHGAHELFFGVETVACPQALPHLPADPGPVVEPPANEPPPVPDPGNGGNTVDTTPDPGTGNSLEEVDPPAGVATAPVEPELASSAAEQAELAQFSRPVPAADHDDVPSGGSFGWWLAASAAGATAAVVVAVRRSAAGSLTPTESGV